MSPQYHYSTPPCVCCSGAAVYQHIITQPPPPTWLLLPYRHHRCHRRLGLGTVVSCSKVHTMLNTQQPQATAASTTSPSSCVAGWLLLKNHPLASSFQALKFWKFSPICSICMFSLFTWLNYHPLAFSFQAPEFWTFSPICPLYFLVVDLAESPPPDGFFSWVWILSRVYPLSRYWWSNYSASKLIDVSVCPLSS